MFVCVYIISPPYPHPNPHNHPPSTHTHKQAVFFPADDLTDPAPATTFAHLDATTVLSRAISELGIYPAVDPLDSTSRIMDPNIVGAEHYNMARGVQKILEVSAWSLLVLSFCTVGLNYLPVDMMSFRVSTELVKD